MNTYLCLTAVGLACVALGLTLVSLLRRPQTVILIAAEPILPGSKGPSLPSFIAQPPTHYLTRHELTQIHSLSDGGNN